MFTISSWSLASVLSFSKSQKRASSQRRAGKSSSDYPTICITDKFTALSAVTTLSLGEIYVLNSNSDLFIRIACQNPRTH